MNTLTFKVEHVDELKAEWVIPIVDGRPLTEWIESFEREHAMEPWKGAYGGLVPAHFNFGPLDQHYLGKGSSMENAKTVLLGCQCGEWGCWPLLVRVTVDGGRVRWIEFEQPYRPTRDYSAFGPFEFDERQYREALAELARREPT